MKSKISITLFLILSLTALQGYCQEDHFRAIGIHASGYYDSEYALFLLPGLLYTNNSNVLNVALTVPFISDLRINSDNYLEANPHKINQEQKIGFYMNYRRLMPIVNKNYKFYWNISLLNYQMSNNYGTFYNDEQALYTEKGYNFQLVTGLGVELHLIKDLYIFSDLNMGLEKLIAKSTLYVPQSDYYAFKDHRSDYHEVIMALNLGLKFNLINF